LEEVKHKLENIDRKVSRLSVNYIELGSKVDDLALRVEKLEEKLAA
jgi:hypothetical protein